MLIRSFLAYGVSVVSTLSIIEKGIIDVQKAISFKWLVIFSFTLHMLQKSSISSYIKILIIKMTNPGFLNEHKRFR